MIKVLQVVGSLGHHGIEAVIMNYYRHIDPVKIRFDFLVTSQQPQRYDEEVLAKGGRIFRLPTKNRHPFLYGKALKKLLVENKFDIIHVNGNSASIYIDLKIAKKCGIKDRIAHSHNTSCFIKWQHYLLQPLLKKYYTKKIACSREASKWLFGKKEAATALILNNAIELDKFAFHENDRSEIRKLYSIENGQILIGCVGGLTPNKNHLFLIKAFAQALMQNQALRLMIVGGGGLKETLYSYAQELGVADKVTLTSAVDCVEKYYSAFDCFAFPSLYEGLPLVAVEAQANGLQCLISDRVSDEVMISSDAVKASIDSCTEWINFFLTTHVRTEHTKEIQDAGYDIKLAAKTLEDLYLKNFLTSVDS